MGVIIGSHTIHPLYQSRRLGDILSGVFWFETAVLIRILCQIQDAVTVGSSSRIQVSVIHPNTIFGIHLMGQIHELLLISDFFNATR